MKEDTASMRLDKIAIRVLPQIEGSEFIEDGSGTGKGPQRNWSSQAE
jgi:hypothetical protein